MDQMVTSTYSPGTGLSFRSAGEGEADLHVGLLVLPKLIRNGRRIMLNTVTLQICQVHSGKLGLEELTLYPS